MVILKNKFSNDLFFNYLSLFLLGTTGLAVNFFIALLYGSEAIGFFNIIYAIYIVLSQITSLGIWNSALKFVSEKNGAVDSQKEEIFSLILISFISTGLLLVPIYFLTDYFIPLLFNDSINLSWKCVLPGFFCYSVNKTLLAIINGKREMIAYACFISIKYIIILVLLIFFCRFKVEVIYLPLIFALSDIPVTIITSVYLLTPLKLEKKIKLKSLIKSLKYGTRNLAGNIISELNTRIDILMLGLLASEQAVGIYSFASSFVEGFSLILTPLRDNINPIISMLFIKNATDKLKIFLKKCIRFSYLLMSILGSILLCFYCCLILWIFPDEEIRASILVFSILMSGVILISGYLPLNMFLSQVGMPKEQTYMRILCILTNFLGCVLFIPHLGATGAAVSVVLSNIVFVSFLKFFIHRRLRCS